MKIMAVDLGKARTGIAICDESEMLASPCLLYTSLVLRKSLKLTERIKMQPETVFKMWILY